MAMTGLRRMTTGLGLVDEVPPRAILRQKSKGLLRLVPRKKQRLLTEGSHWLVGAVGGAAFGVLPDDVRRRPYAGPLYGLFIWLMFELAVAPALGLSQARRLRPVERVALATDHLFYGYVLSDTRPSDDD